MNLKKLTVLFSAVATLATPTFAAPPSGVKPLPPGVQVATFAGGCFWCMQPAFDAFFGKGVLTTSVGYTGGTKDKPTYEEVSSGATGHRESIEVSYDPNQVGYEKLLEVFWANIDPVDSKGQFCDKGEQYTSAIFTHGAEQKRMAEESKKKQATRLGTSIATEVLAAAKFYPAEDYHQSYYEKNPVRYKFYRFNCGRDKRLKEVWGKSPH